MLGHLFSFGYAERVRREAIGYALAKLGKARVAVDVGAGPGDSVRVLASTGRVGYIVAVEPSGILVQKSCSNGGPLCEPVQAVAEYLPVRDSAADLASSFYAVRDYKDTVVGLRELLRVANVVAIGDIFVPSDPLKRLAVKTWTCIVAPLLASIIYFVKGARYRGICRSLRGWCSVERLAATVADIAGNKVEVAYRGILLGGLGYIVAKKLHRSADRGQRDTVRSETCRSASKPGKT